MVLELGNRKPQFWLGALTPHRGDPGRMLRRLVSSPTLCRCSLPVHRSGAIAAQTNLIDSRLQTPVGAVAADSGRARYRSNRSRRGLYDGKDVRFGNQGERASFDSMAVSEKSLALNPLILSASFRVMTVMTQYRFPTGRREGSGSRTCK